MSSHRQNLENCLPKTKFQNGTLMKTYSNLRLDLIETLKTLNGSHLKTIQDTTEAIKKCLAILITSNVLFSLVKPN